MSALCNIKVVSEQKKITIYIINYYCLVGTRWWAMGFEKFL